MALLSKASLAGAFVGASVVIAFPIIKPVAAAISRPLVKASIKQALVVYERGRALLLRMTEGMEDVLAEVRLEAEEAPPGRAEEEQR